MRDRLKKIYDKSDKTGNYEMVYLRQHYFIISLFFIFLSLLLQAGDASGETEKIAINAKLTVHLYDSRDELREAYTYRNGDRKIMKKVKGFYSELDNSIHCMKWDFYTCGHELYHALQYKGDRELTGEKDLRHFTEKNYASQQTP